MAMVMASPLFPPPLFRSTTPSSVSLCMACCSSGDPSGGSFRSSITFKGTPPVPANMKWNNPTIDTSNALHRQVPTMYPINSHASNTRLLVVPYKFKNHLSKFYSHVRLVSNFTFKLEGGVGSSGSFLEPTAPGGENCKGLVSIAAGLPTTTTAAPIPLLAGCRWFW